MCPKEWEMTGCPEALWGPQDPPGKQEPQGTAWAVCGRVGPAPAGVQRPLLAGHGTSVTVLLLSTSHHAPSLPEKYR